MEAFYFVIEIAMRFVGIFFQIKVVGSLSVGMILTGSFLLGLTLYIIFGALKRG